MEPSSDSMAPQLYRFGSNQISADELFIQRKHVMAMVNIKPVQPLHVIVAPTRYVASFRELTELETLEIYSCA